MEKKLHIDSFLNELKGKEMGVLLNDNKKVLDLIEDLSYQNAIPGDELKEMDCDIMFKAIEVLSAYADNLETTGTTDEQKELMIEYDLQSYNMSCNLMNMLDRSRNAKFKNTNKEDLF